MGSPPSAHSFVPMTTRTENLKHIPRHDQLGFDPEPPGARFERLCPRVQTPARVKRHPQPAVAPRRAA